MAEGRFRCNFGGDLGLEMVSAKGGRHHIVGVSRVAD